MARVNRREYLQSSAAAAALACLPRALARPLRRISPIGLQLYTVRNLMTSDPGGTLRSVAAAGYQEVEFAGYFGLSPKQARAAIDAVGLRAPSCHLDFHAVSSALPQAIEAAVELGHKFLVNSWIDEGVRIRKGGWSQVAEVLNRAGEATEKAGIQMAYHNYWSDFEPMPDGRLPYDLLLERCDSKLVVMEMDLCWVEVGGGDPVDYFNRYPGRFPMVHVKDVKRLPRPSSKEGARLSAERVIPDMTEVGSGTIDWKRIFAGASRAGIEHYFVEHDQPADPIGSIRKSYQFLSTLRF
jgi:sugar phosphate isomerase/epimerase